MSRRPTVSPRGPRLPEQDADPGEVPAKPKAPLLAGVDIGGTTTQVVLCTHTYRVVARTNAATPAHGGAAAMVGLACDLIELLLRQQGACLDQLTAVGIGAAGVVDTQTGFVLVASDSFTDWTGHPVTAILSGRLGVPCFLENDVNAFLLGEVSAGAIAGEPDALAIMLGTGVGGALWLDGRLYAGPHGAAGEIGHTPGFGRLRCTCGGHGHLETLAGGRQLSLRYAERTGRQVSAAEVHERAVGGERDAVVVFDEAGRALGQAITVVAALMDVTTVVVGGGVANAWSLLEPATRRELEAEPPVSGLPIRLHRSALAGDAVAIGAAIQAHRRAAPTATVTR